MDWTIRNATDQDANLLADLIRRSFQDVAERFALTPANCPRHPSNCTADWAKAATEKGIRFYVLEVDGKPYGCVALDHFEPDACKLKRLAVLPEFRGRGYGRALVDHAMEQARTLGVSRVQLGLIAANKRLVEWYARIGFVVERPAVTFEGLPFKRPPIGEIAMSEMERVQSWFDSGVLVRPSADTLNFVDLVHALAHLTGAGNAAPRAGAQKLCGMIGAADHYVFVLVDALGMAQLRTLPPQAFLPKHLVTQLQAVFLSTTGAALTTLATGEWPCSHAVPGWWVHLERFGISAVTLPFQERLTGRPLSELGISAETVFPIPSIWASAEYESLTVLPANIVDSTYSRYASGDTPRVGYTELPQALATIRKVIQDARRPTSIYLYLPHLDEISHRKGTEDEQTRRLIAALDEVLAGLAAGLGGKARIVISADHGQTDVPDARRTVLPEDDPLSVHLQFQPCGEASVPIFHVREGHDEQFAAQFAARFGGHFALLTPEEVERMRLLGPGELTPVTKRRLGTFMGIAPQPAKLYVRPCDRCNPQNIGVHGGLSAAEMDIPLILV
jgi:N-acetylglutamate synthase-like GNAT family acetyltransferase